MDLLSFWPSVCVWISILIGGLTPFLPRILKKILICAALISLRNVQSV
jgi:hypothetical protein